MARTIGPNPKQTMRSSFKAAATMLDKLFNRYARCYTELRPSSGVTQSAQYRHATAPVVEWHSQPQIGRGGLRTGRSAAEPLDHYK
jgi:hypothetical protein